MVFGLGNCQVAVVKASVGGAAEPGSWLWAWTDLDPGLRWRSPVISRARWCWAGVDVREEAGFARIGQWSALTGIASITASPSTSPGFALLSSQVRWIDCPVPMLTTSVSETFTSAPRPVWLA